MLSIGKPTSADYYDHLVADGLDDYYRLGEADSGTWYGRGAEHLELHGRVDADQWRAMLAGRHPEHGYFLRQRASRPTSRAAFDLTFSAPKSVSALWAIADTDTRMTIEDAHHHAVAEALAWLEADAVRSRRGRGGSEAIATHGLTVAAWTHRTSRAGDPQLHTHAVAMNLVECVDGVWRTLDGKELYLGAKTGGYVYQAALRQALTERLGVRWAAPSTRNGTAEIDGIPPVLTERWSSRRAEILAKLEERGRHSPAAAQIATLATRTAKGHHVDTAELRAAWAAEAAELGVDGTDLTATVTGQATVENVDVDTLVAAAYERALNGRATFGPRELLRAVLDSAPVNLTRDQLATLWDRARSHPNLVTVVDGHSPGGTLAPITSWSTRAVVDAEAAVLAFAEAPEPAAIVAAPIVETVLRAHGHLGADQRHALRQIVGDTRRLQVVCGPAGTGKTAMLAAARQAWQAGGFEVTGTALAGKAAQGLTEGAEIPSMVLAQLLGRLDRREIRLHDRSVVVVDETGMIDSRDLARLTTHARQCRARVVLVGDHRQLPEIGAGGIFRDLANRPDTAQLTENRRQRDRWAIDALADLRVGEASTVRTALAEWDRRGLILTRADADAARDALVADYLASADAGEDVLAVASRWSHVTAVNTAIQAIRRDRQELGPPIGTDARGLYLREGDRVVVLRTEVRRGVNNGDRGTLLGDAETGGLAIELDRGGIVAVLPEDVSLGYATTLHRAQGATVDRCLVWGDTLDQQATYVALSRPRLEGRIYTTTDGRDDLLAHNDARDRLAREASRNRTQRSAHDQRSNPQWVHDTIGDRPADPDIAARWDELRAIVDAARAACGWTDPTAALPQRPPAFGTPGYEPWRQAQLALTQQRQRLVTARP